VTRANEARRIDFAVEVQTEHHAILQAVEAGDAEAARQAAATHMGNAIVRIQGAPADFWQHEGERLAQPLVKGLRN
jgi:GntR family transcriptional repressor for pyruvate dehydrogenase complex